MLVIRAGERVFRIFDVLDSGCIERMEHPPLDSQIVCADLTDDKKYVVTAARDGSVAVWSVVLRSEVNRVELMRQRRRKWKPGTYKSVTFYVWICLCVNRGVIIFGGVCFFVVVQAQMMICFPR